MLHHTGDKSQSSWNNHQSNSQTGGKRQKKLFDIDKMTKESNIRDYVIPLEECGSVEVHVEVEL